MVPLEFTSEKSTQKTKKAEEVSTSRIFQMTSTLGTSKMVLPLLAIASSSVQMVKLKQVNTIAMLTVDLITDVLFIM